VLALGVKAVHKTQFLDIENKYGADWYPVGESSFKNALRHDSLNPNTVAVAQAYLDVDYVGDKHYREAFLKRIIERGKPWLQAIQFDMLPWDTDDETLGFLEKVKEQNVEVFLQVHKNAMESLGPNGVIRRLGRHAHLIDYLLFDSSHGTGKRLDAATLTPFIAAAYDSLDLSKTGIALAGGLNGQVVREDLPKLVEQYPDLSWDAEGQLHPINDKGKRPLDLKVTEDYLCASSEILIKP
jgi:phosphoribosylanthranilate isomerase